MKTLHFCWGIPSDLKKEGEKYYYYLLYPSYIYILYPSYIYPYYIYPPGSEGKLTADASGENKARKRLECLLFVSHDRDLWSAARDDVRSYSKN